MLSSGATVLILGLNVIIWDETLSSRTKCYHLGWNAIIWDAMLSSGANVIIWDKMQSSGANVIMVSYGANVIMVSSGANVIIWCYHVMLSSGMITHPFFIFPKNFTHSFITAKLVYDYFINRQFAVIFPFLNETGHQWQGGGFYLRFHQKRGATST